MRRKEECENPLRSIMNIIFTVFAVGALGCNATDLHAGEIASYEDCIEAGYPMMKSIPPRCSTGDGRVFVRGVATPHYIDSTQRNPVGEATSQKGCRDTCGNGRCEEIVCEAVGCPCIETPTSCPDDCSR
ncbi:MAG: hypothetical protein ACO3XO_09275 [Bdellovibrionota bacterium]